MKGLGDRMGIIMDGYRLRELRRRERKWEGEASRGHREESCRFEGGSDRRDRGDNKGC